jgi:hypothetical protein
MGIGVTAQSPIADGQAQDRPLVNTFMELRGAGGYEGWSAILYETSDWESGVSVVNGLVFPGDLPPDR